METTEARQDWREVKIPRPFPGGSYSVESMGRWIDKLLGDDRAQREADASLEPYLMRKEDMPPDPEPVDVPAASSPGLTSSS